MKKKKGNLVESLARRVEVNSKVGTKYMLMATDLEWAYMRVTVHCTESQQILKRDA